MEKETLIIYQVLENLLGGFEVVPSPVEDLFADDLLLFVVEPVEVGVCEALFDRVALVWIKSEHFGQEISRSGLNIRK